MKKSTLFGLLAGLSLMTAATANAAEMPDYTLNPANGDQVTDLTTVTLTFPTTIVGYYESVRPALATIENVTTGSVYYCYEPQVEYIMNEETGTSGIEYTLRFYEMGSDEVAIINEPGKYHFSVRGLYVGDEEGENLEDLPMIAANYTLVYPVDYTLSPATEEPVEDLTTVTLTFPTTLVGYYDQIRPALATIENLTTGATYYCYEPQLEYIMNEETGTSGIEYTLKFYELGGEEVVTINQVGDYLLSVRGLYTGDEEGENLVDLPVLTANYSIAYPVEYTLSPANGYTVDNLTTVTLSFPTTLVGYYDQVRPALASMENLTTGDVYYCYEPQVEYIMNEETGTAGIEYTLKFYEIGSEEVAIITQVGDYLLSVRGLYTGDEEGENLVDLPVLTANYSIAYPVEYTLDPANGETVEEISAIKVTFPETLVGYYDQIRPALATIENIATGDAYYCYEPQVEYIMNEETGTAGIEYTLKFYEIGSEEVAIISEPGEYTLSIRGLYTGDEEGENLVDLPVLTAKYNIAYPIEYTIDPAPNSTVEDLTTIKVIFPETLVAYYEQTRPALATIENIATGDAYYCYEPQVEYIMNEETGTSGIEYTLKFYESGSEEVAIINQPGNYILSLRGLYTGDEEGENTVDLPVITARYEISYPLVYTINPEDGATLSELSEVILTFPGTFNVGFYDVNPAVATLENLDTEDVYYCTTPLRDTNADGDAVYTLTFSELGSTEELVISAEGNYVLTIRGLYTSVYDENEEEVNTDMPVITVYYFIDGSHSIDAVFNADSYTVYNINGVKLISNGNAESLKSLSKGLYIINGKKVIINR